MNFIDYAGKKYTEKELVKFAKEQWEHCYRTGDYYFVLDYPKVKDTQTAINFLNNLYETDKREISFWKAEND